MKYARLKKYALTKLNNILDSNKEFPEGCSGFYVKFPHSVGVKIYFGQYNTRKEVYGCQEWRYAANALHMMNRANKVDIAPKAYCLAPVKVDGKYRVGLFMQHVNGAHPNNLGDRRWKTISTRLKRVGIAHLDIGEHNVMIGPKGKIQVLDWDSGTKYNEDNE